MVKSLRYFVTVLSDKITQECFNTVDMKFTGVYGGRWF
jgi:hypothetical protein